MLSPHKLKHLLRPSTPCFRHLLLNTQTSSTQPPRPTHSVYSPEQAGVGTLRVASIQWSLPLMWRTLHTVPVMHAKLTKPGSYSA